MKLSHIQKEMTLYLTQTLAGYEVIPANFGWHIHKGDNYCGHLQYQGTKGWQGNALSQLPAKLQQQLKKFAQSSSTVQYATTYSVSPTTQSARVA